MTNLFRKLCNHETITYIIFGIITTVIDFVCFGMLHYFFDIGAIFSNTLAWVVAVAFAFITNKLFVFNSKSFAKKNLLHEIVAFVSGRIVTLLLTDFFFIIAEGLSINMMFAKALISVLVIILNYVVSKLFVFKNNNPSEENNMNETPVMSDKIKFRLGYLLAFLIPVVILSGIFIGRDVFPFGDNIYLRSDMYHQYAPFYKELYRKLTEGGSLLYSWNIGMGVNFTALYSYYLASPINLLLGLIAPGGNILITMDVLIILKTGLCGLTCGYYLHKRFGGKDISYAAIGIFYALSSYMAAFSWNIMWLDCLILLPLIVLGLDRLVKENKYILYTLTLGISIFSNYYISIMICIFLVFYFAVRMLASDSENKLKFFVSRILTFAKGSLIAGGIGACMILPEIAALSYTVSGEFNFPEDWQNYFSIINMLSRSLMNVEVSIFNAHEPNLYCTILVFMFVPLYFLCKKISAKEKYGTAFLIGFFLICFNTNIPNYIFHGFHFPNSLPARESFIYIFLLVTVVYQVLLHMDSFTKKEVMGSFAGGVGVILLIEELYVGEAYPFEIIYLSLIFLCLYMLIAMGLRAGKISKTFLIYLFFIVCIGEATVNSDHDASYSTTGYSSYLKDNEAIETLVDRIKDDSFYRIEKISRKTKNDAAWNNYRGVSIFSSTANGHFTDMLGRLGFEKSTNAYSHYGYTPLTSALLSVKYLISNELIEEPYFMSLYDYTEIKNEDPEKDYVESRYLYKLDYTLPLGFMIPKDFTDNWVCEGNNPFAVQNSFIQSATGYTDMFTQIYATSGGSYTTIEPTEDSDIYIYVTNYVDDISWYTELPDGSYGATGDASGLKHRQIVHIGDVPAGSIVNVSTTDAGVSSFQLYAYAFHKDVFDIAMNSLSSEGFEISKFEDTYIKGQITSKEDALMYTSIIYDKGWTAYIDGKEVEISSINDAVLTIPVPAGTHTVELKYFPTSLGIGLVISTVSVALFIGLIIWERKKKKKHDSSIENAEMSDDDSEENLETSDDDSDENVDYTVELDGDNIVENDTDESDTYEDK